MTIAISTEGLVGSGPGGGSGGTAVALANPSPSPGALAADRATAKVTPISVNVYDSGAPVSSSSVPWCILVKFKNDDRPHPVYDSTSGFFLPFASQSKWVASTSTLTLLPDGGWQDDIELLWVGGQADTSIITARSGASGSDLPPNHP